MKAILLSAGFGSRLYPLTQTIPKCLVPIKGIPLLEIWINKLFALGVSEILINTHYLSEKVENFINQLPTRNKINVVHEPILLGTAGTLVANKHFWKNDTCFVIHADNYCGSDLSAMVQAHNQRPAHALSTLLVFQTETPTSCGIVKIDDNNMITDFYEKKNPIYGNLASGALFIFSPQIYQSYFQELSDDKFYELSTDIIPSMINTMLAWHVDSFYIDIGTPQNYQKAQEL